MIWLQELRESANNVLTPFMMNISDFAIFYSILIPSFIYWCLNKRNGLYVFFVIVFNGMLASCIKLTACVYRPWIREPKIIPAGDSIRTATGYSFPSGHTTMATAVYGGSALALRKKWSYILAGLVILTTAFSRNYLGVHTPQDVICGFLLAVFSIRSLAKALKYIEQHRNKENLMLAVLFFLGIATLTYAEYKPYPMDYIDGKLIVDPKKMILEAWHTTGQLFGVIVGRLVEKHFIKFSPSLNFRRVIFSLIGMVVLYFLIKNLTAFVSRFAGLYWRRLITQFITYFYIIAIWPAVMKIFAVSYPKAKGYH